MARRLPYLGMVWTAMGLLGAAACSGPGSDQAATEAVETFSEHIAPILSRHCAVCHYPDGPAPFSLLTYEDVHPRAQLIALVTRRKYMPPWLPHSDAEVFAGERGLSDKEIATLQRWVAQGAVRGGTARVTSPPATGGWLLGTPDLVVTLPDGYTLPPEGHDVFRNFVLPVPVAASQYVRAVEFRPARPRTIHHLTLMIDRTRSSRRLDDEDPMPGYSGMEASAAHSPDGHFVGWTPGRVPSLGPDEMAWLVDPGTDLVLQLHMMPTGRPEPIGLRIGFHFSGTPPTRTPAMIRIGSRTIDIPAGEANYHVTDQFRLPVDVDVLSVYPHAHFLAREMKGWATLPDGTERLLIRIPHWDFNWQDEYRYRQPLHLPRGTVLSMEYVYDNSTANAHNRHKPPTRILYGPQSSDEMGDLWIQVLPSHKEDLAVLNRAFFEKDLNDQTKHAEMRVAQNPADAEAHYLLATCQLRAGRTAQAEMHLQEAIRLAPQHADAQNGLGLLRANEGDGIAATAHFRRALAARPNVADFHFNLSNLLQTQGKTEEAREHLKRAVTLDPGHAGAHNNLGLLVAAQGDLAAAVDHFRHALGARSGQADVHFNLGTVLKAAGRQEEAIDQFQRAVSLNPNHAGAHNNLGVELGSRGHIDDAVAHLRKALAINPSYADAHNNLGAALWTFGDLERARQEFRLALAANPNHADARENLERLTAVAPRH
jgi:tetratricopeptide (TPR) repeat protein/mono/diheme cytochrome c family protein